jgi:hypothetical protein
MYAIRYVEDLNTVEQLTASLEGAQTVVFQVAGDKESCYRWIQGTLVRQQRPYRTASI